jgi:hypothetical protein
MNMNNVLMRALAVVLAFLLAAPAGVFAQGERSHTFSRQELDRMLAPIALYPDSLLAQILVAATFPDQVVEADRWLKDRQGLRKDQLNDELDKQDWDLSVKALIPFPQVLAMMDKDLEWTTKLGEAFMAQQKEVMASVQNMRQKAYANGNLKSNDQQKVAVSGEDIEIQPANPEIVYVPYYDPAVVYGGWWWPGYPPYAFYPYGFDPWMTFGALGFFAGIAVGAYWNWGWGSWNWGRGYCNVNVNRNVNINRNDPNITRNMRTAGFHQAARQGTLGNRAANFAAGRTGVGSRPSTAAVERGLSGGRTGVTRGGARGTGNALSGGGARGNAFRGDGNREFDMPRGGAERFGGGERGFDGGGGHFGGGGGGGRR